MLQHIIHYFLHFGAPLFIAIIFFRDEWQKTYIIFLLTMLIDLDHIIATPIFDSNRCSINFHPLHSYYATFFYTLLLFLKKPFKLIGLGLLLHILTDFIDCFMTYSKCNNCIFDESVEELILFLKNLI